MENDQSPDPALQTAKLYIGGMTCGSCELLLERKLRHVTGILAADVDHRTGTALITARSDALPSIKKLQYVIEQAGYTLLEDPPLSTFHQRKWLEIGGALVVILALGKLLSTFNLVSLAPSTSGAITLGGTFLIGLVAGTSSCLAVTGGLLMSVAAKHNELHQGETSWKKFQPL
ncbi:cation transporter, partial [Candidatus Peregrinibacteria bacterium]|nr:cation transporter [Candidatus Peregrinibacteria bacterium]